MAGLEYRRLNIMLLTTVSIGLHISSKEHDLAEGRKKQTAQMCGPHESNPWFVIRI